jgi:Sulfotransferase domain
MQRMRELLTSPELYPVILDTETRVLKFVRMSPETYRKSVFLDLRTQYIGSASYDIRLDDLLLAASRVPQKDVRVHYILNSAYCCSTLLARYFELLPSCFVLKEPRLLSQVAVMERQPDLPWEPVFDLCTRLLCRTYQPAQSVVMKPVDCCSLIGEQLLAQNPKASLTFLMIPLRQFLLSILKSGERRDWVRMRMRTVFKDRGGCPALADVEVESLGVAEAAACLWLTHRWLAEQLISGPNSSRVLLVDGQQLADDPAPILRAIARISGIDIGEVQVQELVDHPSTRKYSKDASRPYDATSRQHEFKELERCWAREADSGLEWAAQHGWTGTEAQICATASLA